MSELHASGLLVEDASDTEEESQDNAAATTEADVSDVSAAVSAQTSAEQVDEAQESSQAAEQRVLGALQGCPGWSEVRV